ncbi:MAG: tRNA (adenosine(37)-N6)-threonylcarbamoyltransferase complex ATPase subunit type 1 TsaE [Holosporales bacterium]|jgi:tRNA threonylcarbamoyl adenosine modification protein YjeE|nr:tRNA (adenosine(37)-N6)-threonylcarbamoyltransferase complex ATPase subunit type 1 TsaE [Holosporales bacterium]
MKREELGVFFCPKPFSTESLAMCLAQRVLPQDVIVLQGEIGAGKTTFAKALIKKIVASPCITRSPAFPLIQEYEIVHGRLLHCDFYRLHEREEVSGFCLDEVLDHEVVLIEWAERLPPYFLTKNYLTIRFEQRPSGRLLYVSGNVTWRSRVTSISFSSL